MDPMGSMGIGIGCFRDAGLLTAFMGPPEPGMIHAQRPNAI